LENSKKIKSKTPKNSHWYWLTMTLNSGNYDTKLGKLWH
jgi:hypothetical protein